MKNIEDVIAGYFRAWNAPTLEEARARIEESCAPTLLYRDPKYTARGQAEMAQRTRISHEKWPGFRVFVTTVIDGYDELFRYEWDFVARNGQVRLPGIDIISRDSDGRIATITSFFGERVVLAPEEPLRVGPRWTS